ncbi:hypothetical protein D1872_52030 [compost metagenome]
MITLDSKLLEEIKASSCFGIAHDDTVPECKRCDLKEQCKRKAEGAFVEPPREKVKSVTKAPAATEKADKPKVTKTDKPKTSAASKPGKKTEAKPSAPSPNGMPDFKPMSIDELKALAVSRNVEWKEFDNANITRMRLIMELKKSYS